MRTLRIALQVIFGLLSAILVFVFLAAPNADYASNLSMLAVFVLIILVLGPWWPSAENIERWEKRWNFKLPTDNIEVAKYVANYLASAFGFYRAWYVYTNPTSELGRFENFPFAVAGKSGVIVFWVMIGFAGLAYGIAIHVRSRQTKKSSQQTR